MQNREIIKKSYTHGLFVFVILMAFNFLLSSFNFVWAKKSYEIIIIVLFSCIVSFSEMTIKLNRRARYKKNRFPFLLIGIISSITVISYVRDVINDTITITKNGILTDESCIFIIGGMFLGLFFAYLYKEFKIGEEMNSR